MVPSSGVPGSRHRGERVSRAPDLDNLTNGWVDVYRIELEDWPPLWIKLRLEEMKKKEIVMVIILHEFEE